jgi:hypothetical protein
MRSPIRVPYPGGSRHALCENQAAIPHSKERNHNLTMNSESESMQDRIARVSSDLSNLTAFYKVTSSPTRYARLQEFFDAEMKSLEDSDFSTYDQNGIVDYLLLRNYLRSQIFELRQEAEKDEKVLTFLGGYFTLRLTFSLIEARQRVDDMDSKQAATHITEILKHIATVKDRIVGGKETTDPSTGLRAANALSELKSHLQEWYGFYQNHDPLFTYWVSDPYPKLEAALQDLADTIKRVILGIEPSDTDTIIGEPIGREGILNALKAEMIVYSPEELIDIGYKEYEWCEKEMQKAASALGFQDWRDALEHVKNQYVEPGQQPKLVRDLTHEATEYVKKYDRVSVPFVSEETIRTFMMSPEDQKMNPFFLGGDSIIVSYPTSTMDHEQKLMSLRGNNVHFSRATVFHEMIPGHHLHYYYMSRFHTYRSLFRTPFCIEGWAFYWEMLLWDADSWPKTPENRIGMLFWRMHRCARIVFSLNYHLGEMSAEECIELLVSWVGHERATAEGEVRRSVMGNYGPLYQAGYMLGGLQLYALRKEIVGEDLSKEKWYHDSFLKANQMPVEMFRALIKQQPLSKDFESEWRFYE